MLMSELYKIVKENRTKECNFVIENNIEYKWRCEASNATSPPIPFSFREMEMVLKKTDFSIENLFVTFDNVNPERPTVFNIRTELGSERMIIPELTNIRETIGYNSDDYLTVIEIGDYWVDKSGNRWIIWRYSRAAATRLSQTLNGCTGCTNCEDCKNCTNCEDCISCKDCEHCVDCISCNNCKHCENCTNCNDCEDCEECINCKNCTDCKDCTNCKDCANCEDCINCKDCSGCEDHANHNNLHNTGTKQEEPNDEL